MAEPSPKTEFTDEERAVGVDENGKTLTPEQRKDSTNPKDKAKDQEKELPQEKK